MTHSTLLSRFSQRSGRLYSSKEKYILWDPSQQDRLSHTCEIWYKLQWLVVALCNTEPGADIQYSIQTNNRGSTFHLSKLIFFWYLYLVFFILSFYRITCLRISFFAECVVPCFHSWKFPDLALALQHRHLCWQTSALHNGGWGTDYSGVPLIYDR